MNKACIVKLGWKLKIRESSLWCEATRGKYKRHGELGSGPQAINYDSTMSKTIIILWPHLEQMSFWEVGNGNNTRAWKDCWVQLGLKLQDHMIQPNEISGFYTVTGLRTKDGEFGTCSGICSTKICWTKY